MVQELESKPNAFGRLGQGISKGLSDVIPKEVERYRLSEGLKQFEKDAPNLNLMQQYARLASLPGSTAQLLQTFGDLAKNQTLRQVYGQQGTGSENPRRRGIPSSPQPEGPNQTLSAGRQALQGVNFLNLTPARSEEKRMKPLREENIASNYPSAEAEAKSHPRTTRNPLSPELQPVLPWTTEEKELYKGFLLRRNPHMTDAEAEQQAIDAEARELARPTAEQEIENNKNKIRQDLNNEFKKRLETSLQKKDDEIYKDITGDMLLKLQDRAYDDLSTDPTLTKEAAADKWIKKGKQLVETRSLLKGMAYRDIPDSILSGKKEEVLKRLMSAQKIFSETGNNNEFYDMLRTKNAPANLDSNGNIIEPAKFGFNLSPSGSALIAYPRSKNVKTMLKDNENWHKYAPGPYTQKLPEQSKKFAKDIWPKMTDEDSIQAVAREMKENNRFFDEKEFFNYFRENQDNLGLTPHQKQELVTGVSDVFPNWGDLFLFPIYGKSVAND